MADYDEQSSQDPDEIGRGRVEVGEPKRNSNSQETFQDIADKNGVTIFLSENTQRVCCANVTAPVLPDINTGDSSSNETKRDGSKKISNQSRGKIDHSEWFTIAKYPR